MEIKILPISQLKSNTGQIKGVPKNPRLIKDDRFNKHIKKLEKQATKKRTWLEMLFSKNMKPICNVVEGLENEEVARTREQFYVDLHKKTVLNIHNPEKGRCSNKWK